MESGNACGSECALSTRVRFLSRVRPDVRSHAPDVVRKVVARIADKLVSKRIRPNHTLAGSTMFDQFIQIRREDRFAVDAKWRERVICNERGEKFFTSKRFIGIGNYAVRITR